MQPSLWLLIHIEQWHDLLKCQHRLYGKLMTWDEPSIQTPFTLTKTSNGTIDHNNIADFLNYTYYWVKQDVIVEHSSAVVYQPLCSVVVVAMRCGLKYMGIIAHQCFCPSIFDLQLRTDPGRHQMTSMQWESLCNWHILQRMVHPFHWTSMLAHISHQNVSNTFHKTYSLLHRHLPNL